MNPKLKEVNDLYLQIQDYIDPTVEYLAGLTEEQRLELESNADEHLRLYEIAIEKYREVAPALSPDEIIEGYKQGCRLLQRTLSGHMCYAFDKVYIPIMIQAVRNDEAHTAYLFVQSLADHLGKEIAPLVIEALDSESALTRERALAVVRQLELVEALPTVRGMVNDPYLEISYLAKDILNRWEGGTKE